MPELKIIRVIKQTDGKKILLCEEHETGKKYVVREFNEDKRAIFKAIANITHPNIVHIEKVEFTDKTIVTEECAQGELLSEFLEHGSLSKMQIKLIAVQLASAMNELHKNGIIHRDIKPDNIIIKTDSSGKPHITLIDFDIARFYRNELRQDTEVLGTVGYAPVEQFGIMPTDYKTDIYSYGATLEEILDRYGIKGKFLKIAKRCKKLDPNERYESAGKLILVLTGKKIHTIIAFLILAVLIITVTVFLFFAKREDVSSTVSENDKLVEKNENDMSDEYITVSSDSEYADLIKFYGFENSEKMSEYMELDNKVAGDMLSVEGLTMHINFWVDEQNSGYVFMGNDNDSVIYSETELMDGVFTISLEDETGNTFNRTFKIPEDFKYEIRYTQNRRINAEIICRDMNGDNYDELIIGLADCSFNVVGETLYPYYNSVVAYVIEYNEIYGFNLCEGYGYTENGEIVFVEDEAYMFRPYYADNSDGIYGYELKNGKILALSY